MSTPSLRDFLDGAPRVAAIAVPVPLDQVGAIYSLTEGGPPLILEDVAGERVVGNVLTTRADVARALGVEPDGISTALLDSIARPLPAREVESGPVLEHTGPADLTALPIPEFFEKESGPYLTSGVIVVRDVLTGERNLSYARFKVLSPTTAMLGVSPNHHLGQMARRAGEAGRDLPIAVVLGAHPAIMLAACLYLGFGDDELECAGRLLGAPVDVVRTAADLLVPAAAELVLEGVVHPDERVEEGLVSEFHGRYHDYGPGYLTTFTGVRRRADALVQTIVPGLHSEHLLLGAVSIAAGLLARLREVAPNVVDVAVPLDGAGRTAAVVTVRDPQPGQARAVIEAVFAAVRLIKQVVVVDDGVDPWNADAVEWARLAHARPERDFLIVEGRTDRSDPLARAAADDATRSVFTLGKLGVDATAKPGERAEGWDYARVPAAAEAAARATLAAAGVPVARTPLVTGTAGI